jgi:hypothetical protein
MMRKCQECGRAGSVAARTPVALCETCDAAIAAEVHECVRTIHEALRLLREEGTLSGKIREWDRILAQVERLRQYEEREILTTCPPPSILFQDFRARREALQRGSGAPEYPGH